VGSLDNLRTLVRTAREAGIAIYHVPHHRWEPGDYLNWKYPSPYQLGGAERQIFAKGTWGGTFHDNCQVQRATSLQRNTGLPVVFRIPTSTTSSSATAREDHHDWLGSDGANRDGAGLSRDAGS
jgi:nicotinamidase-related amidase